MSARINYNRITGSNIQGDATTVTEPLGTLVVTNNGDLRLHDGSVAGGNFIAGIPDSDWVNANSHTWSIRTYNGGNAVAFDGTTPVAWFDAANSPLGNSQFRGAIIEYHAFIGGNSNGNGTMVGTIHLAQDWDPEEATHTEHLSGNYGLQYISLWGGNPFDRGKLFFKSTNNVAATLMIQWTAKIFYGSEMDC
jgi:hypothetical protein